MGNILLHECLVLFGVELRADANHQTVVRVIKPLFPPAWHLVKLVIQLIFYHTRVRKYHLQNGSHNSKIQPALFFLSFAHRDENFSTSRYYFSHFFPKISSLYLAKPWKYAFYNFGVFIWVVHSSSSSSS